MTDAQTDFREDKAYPINKVYICGVLIITIILLILRIVFYFDTTSQFTLYRDVDFGTLHGLNGNGLFDYYRYPSIDGFRAIYLYYWYFIFFPFHFIPLEIGVYIWDVLRLITAFYIAKNISKVTDNKKDLIVFFILSGMGYTIDAYLNNTNWLLQLLLFESYMMYDKDKKWLAGIFFALAMYKINILIFPFILIIIKKIRIKDLIYYIVPLMVLCVPYIIFPEYAFQLINNWTYIEAGASENTSIILRFYLISWQAIQTAQLMFMGFIVLVFLSNIKNEKIRTRSRLIIFLFVIILTLSFPLILWQVT